MDTVGLIRTGPLLIFSIFVCVITGSPLGDVEVFTGIAPGSNVKLVNNIFNSHLEFLELIFTLGETNATVRTKKPLDADLLALSDSTLYYSVMCDGPVKYNNSRNPVFEKKTYTTDVSEAPTSEDFSLLNSGAFILKRRLNYNLVQKYNFLVTARDNWGLNDTATIGHFRTIEPAAIKAEDGDKGIMIPLTYSISAVSPDKYRSNFNIDSSSGVVSVRTALDREEMDVRMIDVSIKAAQTDDILKTADALVTVSVEDVNDNLPEFDKPNYSVTLLENSPVDAVLFKPVVTDLDQGGFVGTLRIVPDSAPFSVGADGTVRVKNSTVLDRETTERFTFQIEAREANPPHNNVTVQVSVTLLDENDNSPVFTSNTYEGKVYANQTEGMSLVQVKAEDLDADKNGQIKYSIEFGNDDGYFSIDENSGNIALAKTIPLEENVLLEFPLFITARDGGTISRSSSAQVNIRAPGDSKPQFLQKLYRGTVEEEQEPGVVILTVNFLALSAEHPPTLTVVTEPDKFTISNSGEFSTKVKLDYDEAPHNYTVTISISDGSHSDSGVVVVQVTDVNDNGPVFTSSSFTKSVPEDAELGSNVTVVPATDKDSSFNKEIRYSLRGGEGRFSVDAVSGMVSVAASLDRESKADYELLVVAEDQGRPVRSASASLADSSHRHQRSHPKVLRSPSSDTPVFALNSSSGTLRLLQPLDYSRVKEYRLVVQASDGGTPSLVGNGSVVLKVKDVNNNPPQFSKERYDVTVSENLAGGSSILSLEVTDRDEGGFSDGYFIYNNDTFDINNQGVVSLRKDVTLDRETKDSYILQVVAVDQVVDGLRATTQLNISVLDYNDNAPQFPIIPDPLQVLEGDYSEKNPGEILMIVPTDADLGPNGEVTLSLTSPHPLFRFRESKETYELVVKASDNGSPQRENITTIRVSLLDVNDNRPEFSSSSFTSSVLLKDAEEGKLLLTLSASDRDQGNNSLIRYSFSEGSSPYLALNSETGAVTLTSNLAAVKEDTMLVLKAMATDQGRPPLNSTADVVVNLRVASLSEGVAFLRSSYNFSLRENQPAGGEVGRVSAASGSPIYDVIYSLKTHSDLFSINASGAIRSRTQLDREEQDWYILDVEAVDTRSPPTSAIAMVRVEVEDVNEAPQFSSEVYKASVFSIAPYKTPVVYVKASDPDFGEGAQLVYSLTADSQFFAVDPSSGLLFVVSAQSLSGPNTLELKASDPRGLSATTRVEVEVRGGASSGDIVVISINQPANIVEKKVPELEKSLGAALGLTVNILEVWSSNGGSSRASASVRTLISFISEDGGKVVPSEDITQKLQSQAAAVRAELVKVFGDGLLFEVEIEPEGPASSQPAIIALGVLLALSMLGLIVAVAFIIRFKRSQKHEQDSDEESFDIGRNAEGYTNKSLNGAEASEQTRGQENAAEDGETDGDSVRFKANAPWKNEERDGEESRTTL
ncbi:Protocadherin Fat 4 [Dissostichus eleginoides]|uniref:Protocadherin Fat 4 n=1 Tax=Dissostichus eleginoides TaxID=100907 RepID=A0AAD9BNL7_DISEL|nr:Protocadherin Fat 4 [Dissostichus eleginoides]